MTKYIPKTQRIMEDDQLVCEVHGLSFNAIVGLINLNRPAMEALFNQFQGRDLESIDENEISSIGMDVLASAPSMVAQVIALASDAYEDETEDSPLETIMDYPLGVQLACLQAIGPLTFSSWDGAKKLLALAMKAARGGNQSAS